MSVDEVIAFLKSEIPGASFGKSVMPGHANYERAKEVNFVRCQCAANDPNWVYPEFIGKTTRGAYLYVGCDGRSKTISCGAKGYHSERYHDNEPCV